MKLKQFSKKSVSILLAVTMMISAIFVGTFTTTAADVAPVESEADVSTVASVASETFTANSTLYLDIGSTWKELTPNTNTPKVSFCYSDSTNDLNSPISTVALTNNVSGSIYSVQVPNNQYVRALRLERHNKNNDSEIWDSVVTKASDRTADTDNLFTITNYHDTVGWSKYSGSGGGNSSSKTYYLIGDPLGNWNSNKTSYPINTSDGEDHFYYEVKLTNGQYFALYDGSNQYGPSSNGTELKVGVDGVKVSQNSNAFKFTGDTGTYRVKIDTQDPPYVWIENTSSGGDENWYLIGDYFGSWSTSNTTHKLTYDAETKYYTYTAKFSSGNYFRLHDGSKEYQVDSSSNVDMVENQHYTFKERSQDANFHISSAGSYKFYLDSSKKEFWYEKYDSNDYTVSVDNGISKVSGKKTYFDKDETKTSEITKAKTNLTTQFSTKLTDTFNYTVKENGKEVSKTSYQYKVYGYSVLITLEDGTKVVKSVTENDITYSGNGLYTASYTFPSDISSATVTPIYTVSDDYAEQMGIYFTTVYLKHEPGNKTFLNGVYEPRYYVWRAKSGSTVTVTNINGQQVTLDREPTGGYPGQKMLYVEDNTYMAVVESYLYGITFDDGNNNSKQTFDFDEFIRLQKLGYNNITFEPKTNSGITISTAIQNSVSSDREKVYTSSTSKSVNITGSNLYTEFQVYKNLEGNYIDVFGNPLVRTTAYNGSTKINENDADVKNLSGETLVNKLLALVGKSSSKALYGARYGTAAKGNAYDVSSNFGMEYAIRVYYFTYTTNTANMVAQMISGYGAIEYNYYNKNTTITNAARYLKADGTNNTANATKDGVIGMDWGYYLGSSTTKTNFSPTDYSIIPKDYAGVPYLVSYMTENSNRIDGRWYYTKDTTQFDVEVKVGTGDVTTGKLTGFNENDEVGTVKINNKSDNPCKVNQGENALIQAAAKNGYKFVGYYDQNNNFITNDSDYSRLIAASTTIYAIFEKVADGTLTVRNDIFRDKKEYSIGSGITGVEIKVYGADGKLKATYGGRDSEVASNIDPLSETDQYQIILYGKANGDDSFVRFLAAALSLYDGETDYTTLDGDLAEDGLGLKKEEGTDGENPTFIYTFAKVSWKQITDQYKSKSISLQYYTDITRASNLATLTYEYLDRFDQKQTYVVTGVKLSDAEINGTLTQDEALQWPALKYCPSKSKVLANAPEIDDLYKDCQWVCTGAEENLDIGVANVYLVAQQTPKAINTYVQYYDSSKGQLVSETLKAEDGGPLYYNDLVYLYTPDSYLDKDGKPVNFAFWKQFDVNEKGQAVDRANPSHILTAEEMLSDDYGAIFSTFSYIGIRVTVDKMYVACYNVTDNTGTDFNIEMRDAVYSREKYTDDDDTDILYDYIYADFALQFTVFNHPGDTHGKLTFKDLVKTANGNGDLGYNNYRNIKFGVLTIATDYNYDPEVQQPQVTKVPEEDIYGMIDKDLDKPEGSFTSDLYRNSSGYGYNYMNRNLNNVVDDLTILGRYDYYLKFQNNPGYYSIVYTVYSYICYEECENGQWTKKYELSKPRALNIYAAGTQEAKTE